MEIKQLKNGNLLITIPMVLATSGQKKQIILPEAPHMGASPLLVHIARALHWQKMIDSGKFKNIKELASVIGIDSSFVARTMRFASLSPRLIHKIIKGEISPSIESCGEGFSILWSDQEEQFLSK